MAEETPVAAAVRLFLLVWGGEQVLELTVCPGKSDEPIVVADLKRVIEERLGIVADDQRLLLDGVEIGGDDTVELIDGCGMNRKGGSKVHLVNRTARGASDR